MASILIKNIGTLVTGKLESPLRRADSIFINDGVIQHLRVAATSGHTQVVKVLLKHGADPNIRGKDGLTAISFAKARVHVEIVNLLRAAGADE